jgi:hypothetical protein
MTVREHLRKAHEAIAATHRELSNHHSTDKALSAIHDRAASAHEAMCDECSKAADGDLNKLVPSPITNVTPDRRPTITPVPRTGARPVNERPAAPNVPLEFVKLFSTDEENEELERPIL